MLERVSFSDNELSLEAIAFYHDHVQAALFEFFANESPALLSRFPFGSVEKARETRLNEWDFSSSMSVMAALEAAIRIDYLSRVYERRRDALSRACGYCAMKRQIEQSWRATFSCAGPMRPPSRRA